jgi:riboflavin kinase/FMN adenylyltransferase
MIIHHGLDVGLLPASVVTLGMFDGVHQGHQALLHGCLRQAERLGLPAVVLTYDPHPSRVLRPEAPVRQLTPLPEKLARLGRYPLDQIVIARFTPEFAQLGAEEYLERVIASLHPKAIVVGYRTTFGKGRAGTAEVLTAFGARAGIAVEIVPPVAVRGVPVSSTQIRESLDRGDVAFAAELLGYRYQLSGSVGRGDGRGRQLGVPTANLEPEPEKLIPADGVYAVNVETCGATYRGVMSLGARPTFDRPRTIEIYLLDFTGDLYGQPLTAVFLTRLRDICRYNSVDALMMQIREDIARARVV